jgi:hypothetical protein
MGATWTGASNLSLVGADLAGIMFDEICASGREPRELIMSIGAGTSSKGAQDCLESATRRRTAILAGWLLTAHQDCVDHVYFVEHISMQASEVTKLKCARHFGTVALWLVMWLVWWLLLFPSKGWFAPASIHFQ